MANDIHLEKLMQGSISWNRWRNENDMYAQQRNPDLSKSNLSNLPLRGVDLSGADLSHSNMYCTNFLDADLSHTNLQNSDLSYACLAYADLTWANLEGCNLSYAKLKYARLVNTSFKNAILTGCEVYGISAWKLNLEGAIQTDLVITPDDEPILTLDNLEVAQFIYLILNNKKIREVIDSISSKVILILGRFTPERKAILNLIREKLRNSNYLPIMFDFEKPSNRDTHETITMLARMACLVIADITNPKSIPQELVSIVETLPSLPIQPLLENGNEPWGMYDHIKKYPWVLPILNYHNHEELISSFENKIMRISQDRLNKLKTL